jgi:glycerol uptake facilitator-like aquaporin
MKFTETQELIAEFFGIILILFGDGVAAMVVLFGKNIPWPGGAKAAILHGADIIPSITVVREWIGAKRVADSQPRPTRPECD